MLDTFDVVMWWWLGVNRTLNRLESETRLDVNTVQCRARVCLCFSVRSVLVSFSYCSTQITTTTRGTKLILTY